MKLNWDFHHSDKQEYVDNIVRICWFLECLRTIKFEDKWDPHLARVVDVFAYTYM